MPTKRKSTDFLGFESTTSDTTTITFTDSQPSTSTKKTRKKLRMSYNPANPTPAPSSKSSPPTLLDSPAAIDQDNLVTTGSRSQPIELSEEENEEIEFDEDEELQDYGQYSDQDIDDFDDDYDDFDEDASMNAEEEEEEDDDYYEFLDKLKTPKIYETEFEVLSPADLHKMEKNTIEHVSGFLSVTEAQARALLWTFKWQADPLIEAYVDNRAKILEKSGLLVDETTGNPISIAPYSVSIAQPGYFCFICCEEATKNKPFYTFEIDCHHSLCVDCYRNYLRGKIVEHGESRQIKCPQFPCKLQIPEEAVFYLFVGDGATKTNNNDSSFSNTTKPQESKKRVFEKYQNLLDKDFVTLTDKTAFCPAPDCDKIIKCSKAVEDPSRKVPGVKCSCGKEFCFACSLDDHMPAPCKVAKAWLKKCQDDSETANWISANTKECAKCHSTIEKSGGCNHMTCQKCKHEFCWICMGEWSLHGTSYYNCSRYDEADSLAARTEQDKSRSQLKRYLHYYNRYMNHLDSLKRDSETFEQMQEKMKELQETAGMSWIEVQFLSQAFDVLRASRHTMTWTYAFAYYLQKTHRTIIFEDNQNDLEVAVEQLSELFERPAVDLASLKINLLDKCQYVSSRRLVLLEDVAQGLLDNDWKYNVTF